MEEHLAECLAENRIYTLYEGGITMLRKLFNGRRKVVTWTVLAVILVSALAIGFSGVAGFKNGKASVSVASSGVPIFTESSLPPVALFEQVAPFDVVLDAKEWKLINTRGIELSIDVPGGYVYEKEGYAVLRVEKDGTIYVREAKFQTEVPVPIANGEAIKWVKFRVKTSAVKDNFESTCCGRGPIRASKEGTIDFKTGFFQLPWILEAEAEGVLERLLVKPFTVYYLTWGFLGKDIIMPGVSYGDFGLHLGLKDIPREVEKGIELLRRATPSAEEPPSGEPQLDCLFLCNDNSTKRATMPFVGLLMRYIDRVPDQYRNAVMRELALSLAALQGR